MNKDVANVLAPTGRLRAAINYSNIVLAQHDEATGEPLGVSVELAERMAGRIGTPLEIVPFYSAAATFAALTVSTVDVAFLALDPSRAAEAFFSPPYVLIEGTYLVHENGIADVADADVPGMRIAVVRGSAYDLHLARTLVHARLVYYPTESDAAEALCKGEADLVAGVRQILDVAAIGKSGHRVLAGRFMTIRQAVCIPKHRDEGQPFIRDFVEDMKASGVVARALERSAQGAALVAPPYRSDEVIEVIE